MDTLLSDAALTERARCGDDEAFRALYERHRPAVERVCRNWLRDPHLVEDAVQEVFFRAYRALPRFAGGADIRRWLRRIAKNHCHDVWRAQSRIDVAGTPESMYAEPADPATVNIANEAADRLAMQAVLRTLDRRDAMLLVERHLGGAPVGALATRWGMTRASMDVALHRARKRARHHASAEGLRSLLPLGLLRRWSLSAQRLGEASPGTGMVAMGVCQLAVVAALVLPAQTPASPAPVDGSPAETVVTEHRDVARRAPKRPSAPQSAAAGSQSDAQSPATAAEGDTPAPPAAYQESGRGDGPLDGDGVAVPATDARVHRQRPPAEERDRSVGVRVGDEPIGVDTYYADGDSVPHEVACTALAPTDGLTYCDP